MHFPLPHGANPVGNVLERRDELRKQLGGAVVISHQRLLQTLLVEPLQRLAGPLLKRLEGLAILGKNILLNLQLGPLHLHLLLQLLQAAALRGLRLRQLLQLSISSFSKPFSNLLAR